MSGRIRMDDAGPGTGPAASPPPTEQPNRQRSPAEPVERENIQTSADSPKPEEASHASPDGGAEASEETPASETERGGRQELPEDVRKRLDRLNWERYEARRERDEARLQLAAWQQQQRQQQPAGPERDAEERAYQRFQQEQATQQFNQACNDLWQRGLDEYGQDMGEAKRGLDAVGWGNRPDALAALTQLPDGHRIYRELATDLDNAARILNLPPMAMATALARMSRDTTDPSNAGNVSREANREPPVSRAPPPLRPVGGNSSRSEQPLDKVSMAEFIRRRDRDERGSRIRR